MRPHARKWRYKCRCWFNLALWYVKFAFKKMATHQKTWLTNVKWKRVFWFFLIYKYTILRLSQSKFNISWVKNSLRVKGQFMAWLHVISQNWTNLQDWVCKYSSIYVRSQNWNQDFWGKKTKLEPRANQRLTNFSGFFYYHPMG